MIKRSIIVLISLILIQTLVFSQDYAKIHQLIIEGIDAVYDVDLQTALTKFQEAKKTAPNDLRGPFFEATIYFWKAMLSRNKDEFETYMNLSDKIVEHCENVIDKNDNDLDAKLYLGWTYTMRAFIMGFLGENYLKAASEIKDGSENLKYIIEKNPNYYDAYLGLGVYNYLLSFIPRKLQWATAILGFSGDRDEGKRMLTIASEKGVYTSSEAKFYMTILLWREENYPLAESYATSLKNKYPRSPAVWMLWGGLLSQQDKMTEAIDAYEKSLEYNKGKESDIIFRTAYGALGTAYFRLNIFDKAVEYGKRYINYLIKDQNMNNRLHSIGVSLELLGNRNDALEYYGKARTDFKDDNDWERFWLRKLKQREANPITRTDSLLIVADNNRSVGRLNNALADYNSLITAANQNYSDDIKIQINHGLALTYYKQKDYNKAIELFKSNLALNPANEKWLVPEACFQIGRCYMRLGNRDEAKKYFDKTEEYDYDYDFKGSMDQKIKNELSKQ
ncbi:MAG TPA: tetratricopeptide repeat protein [Ignavibacteria bacterium]